MDVQGDTGCRSGRLGEGEGYPERLSGIAPNQKETVVEGWGAVPHGPVRTQWLLSFLTASPSKPKLSVAIAEDLWGRTQASRRAPTQNPPCVPGFRGGKQDN